MNLYPLAKKFLFTLDAEEAHHFTIDNLQLLGKAPWLLRLLAGGGQQHPALRKTVFGIDFPNPIGLAAGLDKNGEVIDEMGMLGFGFVEIGTITPRPQPGNDKPRLFRLPKNKALINRMGFNNVGAEVALQKLKRRKTDVIVGANIGKNKTTANEDAVNDYVYCFKLLQDHAHYFVVNVSSPNTPGLRALQDKDSLLHILNAVQDVNHARQQPRPLLLKIAPDLTPEQLNDVIAVAKQTRLQGIIATNTTIERTGLDYPEAEVAAIGVGGLSGSPLTQKATAVIEHLHHGLAQENIPIIGVGGIMTAQDALDKLKAGASLIQLYTGFIYSGPQLIRDIQQALIKQP